MSVAIKSKKKSYKKGSYKKYEHIGYREFIKDPVKYVSPTAIHPKTLEDLKKNDYRSFKFTDNYNNFVKKMKSDEAQAVMKSTGIFLIIMSSLVILNKEVFETMVIAFENVYAQDQFKNKEIYKISYGVIKEYIKLLRKLSHIRFVYHVATLIYIFFEGIPYAYSMAKDLKSESFLKILQNLTGNLVKMEDISSVPQKERDKKEKEVKTKKEEANIRLEQQQLIRLGIQREEALFKK